MRLFPENQTSDGCKSVESGAVAQPNLARLICFELSARGLRPATKRAGRSAGKLQTSYNVSRTCEDFGLRRATEIVDGLSPHEKTALVSGNRFSHQLLTG